MRGQRPKAAAAPFGVDVFTAIEQAALDAIPTALCVCTAEGALVRYNRRAVGLWGRACRSAIQTSTMAPAFGAIRPTALPCPLPQRR